MKQQVLQWIQQGMSINPSLVSLLSILLVCLVIMFNKRGSTKYNLPPSPPKLPLIGNLHQLSGLPHHTLWALSKKYGPLMLLHLGHVPTLVVSSADIAREVMKTQDHVFSSRPQLVNSKRLLYGKDLVFGPYGEYWRQLRKICVLQLLSAKKVKSFRSVREQEVGLMMQAIHASSTSVNLKNIIVALSNNIVCRAAFGKKYNEEKGETRFKAIIAELAYLMGIFNVADFIPSLSWVNYLNGLNSRVEKNFRDLDSFLDQVIEEHIEKRSSAGDAAIPEEEEDFVDVMLRISADMTLGMQLDRDNIKAITLDMFGAGTDTSSVQMEWAMAELIAHPDIMEEVQKEVRSISKGKLIVSETDTENMHYLKLIIKETLRLHPSAPLLVPHASVENSQIQGYDIPPNTTVFINAYAIGRDPMFWEDPESFYPKRFLNGGSMASIDFKGQDFQLIPFGAGRRGCPGIFFATSVIELTLANLLNKFDWTLPNGMSIKDFNMEESLGISCSRKNELILTAKPHLF